MKLNTERKREHRKNNITKLMKKHKQQKKKIKQKRRDWRKD